MPLKAPLRGFGSVFFRTGNDSAKARLLHFGWVPTRSPAGIEPCPAGTRQLRTQRAEGAGTEELAAPEISRFYGIVICMYYDERPPPHFHVYCQNAQACVRIDTLDITRGSLPRRAGALVVEWALAHRDDLRDNSSRVEQGEPLRPIAPLE
jgi:hypothetical protein